VNVCLYPFCCLPSKWESTLPTMCQVSWDLPGDTYMVVSLICCLIASTCLMERSQLHKRL
jgi:hypothetical protein